MYALVPAPKTVHAGPPKPQPTNFGSVGAQFRGCESAGWCRFWIESLDPLAQSLHRVYPDSVPRTHSDETISIAVRNRMNSLLASMIHQHKRIMLHELREVEEGMFAATVVVNEANLASDPILLELHGKLERTTQ